MEAFWHSMIAKKLELGLLVGTLRIQKMLRSALFRRRLLRANPKRDAANRIRLFLEATSKAGLAMVMKNFRYKVIVAQRLWRGFMHATAVRMRSLILRFDEIERENREKHKKRRRKALDEKRAKRRACTSSTAPLFLLSFMITIPPQTQHMTLHF